MNSTYLRKLNKAKDFNWIWKSKSWINFPKINKKYFIFKNDR